MISFSQIQNRLGDALNDLGEALTDALAWLEEGDSYNYELAGYKRTPSRRASRSALRSDRKSRPAPLAGSAVARWMA